MKSRGETAAIVQTAVDLAQIKERIGALLSKIGDGEACSGTLTRALHEWRCAAGVELRAARKAFPSSGPKAKGWGEYVASLGLSLDTASNHMKLAEFGERYPTEAAAMSSTADVLRRLGVRQEISRSRSGNPAPAGGEPTAARLEAAGFERIEASAMTVTGPAPRPFVPVLFPDGAPTDEDAAADLGIKLTPAIAAFGDAFERAMISSDPIRRSAAGAETIVGDGPVADFAPSNEVEKQATPVADPLPLEAQTCPLCLPWRERAERAEVEVRDLKSELGELECEISCDETEAIERRADAAEARATAAEAELHTLRNQMQGLQLRAEAAEAERPAGVVEVELRDGTIAELAYERDPAKPKATAKDKGKPAKRKGRAVPRG